MTRFQFKDGKWNDYDARQNGQLQMAFMSGHPTCRVQNKRFDYEVDFTKMTQTNLRTRKIRDIRPPYKLKGKRPSAPIIPKGQTMMIKVPMGANPGSIVAMAHPKGGQFSVQIPEGAAPGSVLMVPIPDVTLVEPPQPSAYPQMYAPQGVPGAQVYAAPGSPQMVAPQYPAVPPPSAPPMQMSAPADTTVASAPPDDSPSAAQTNPLIAKPEKQGMGTCAKVAAGITGVAAVGAVAGAVLIDQGVFNLDDVGDFFADAGDGIADAFEDLGDAIVDLF